MENYIKDLLERLENQDLRPGLKLPDGVKFSSALTIAHDARKEVNQLDNKDYIPILKKLLSKEKVTIKKIHIIRTLIRVADKLRINEIADYILSFVREEKTRWVKEVAIRGLNESQLQIESEREFLFELAQHKDSKIRFDALGLLSKLSENYHERVEKICLQQIDIYKNKDYSLSVLSRVLLKIGTEKSISALKEIVVESKKSETIVPALEAIYRISNKKEIQFYLENFASKRDTYVKRQLTKLICLSGSEKQSELLTERVKTILRKKRTTNMVYMGGTEPEIVTIIKFLDDHSPKESEKLVNWMRNKKLDFLDETEKKWIDKDE